MSKKHSSFVETILIIAIACCILFLNVFTTRKLDELSNAGQEALFIRQDLEYDDNKELAEEILRYQDDACKMIEMYTEDLDLLFSIQFRDEEIPTNDIHEYPDLVKLLYENQEGETVIDVGDYEEVVYYQWVTNTRGETRLIIIYNSMPVVENLWVFHLVSYFTLILVFLLLIRLHLKHYRDKIKEYQTTSAYLRENLKR